MQQTPRELLCSYVLFLTSSLPYSLPHPLTHSLPPHCLACLFVLQPRGDLVMRDPGQGQGTTYTEIHRHRTPPSSSRPAPAPAAAPSASSTPLAATWSPSRTRPEERAILSAGATLVGGGAGGAHQTMHHTPPRAAATAARNNNQHASPHRDGEEAKDSAGGSFMTPPSRGATQQQHLQQPPAQSCDKEARPREVSQQQQQHREQHRAQFVCPCCQLGDLQSREQLLSHMRSCVTLADTEHSPHKQAGQHHQHQLKTPPSVVVVPQPHGSDASISSNASTTYTAAPAPHDSFGGLAQAKAACPFCGKPSSKSSLSAHLLGCQKRKASQERRLQPSKPLLSQSQHTPKDPIPVFAGSPSKSPPVTSRPRTPLSAPHSNHQSRQSPSSSSSTRSHHQSGGGDESSTGGRSQSSRLSSLSQASTVAKGARGHYSSSPMTQRMHAAIQAGRQQLLQGQQYPDLLPQQRGAGTSPLSSSKRRASPAPSRADGGSRRPVIAAFR